MTASTIKLTGRYGGIAAIAAVIALGSVLMATSISAARTEAGLRARIADLTRINARQGAYWAARLSECRAAGPADQDHLANVSAEARARRLTTREPAGFDVCARMESADRAVLDTLK